MKIKSVTYQIEPFDNFEDIYIYEENDNYKIGLRCKSNNLSYVIFKDCVLGAFAYLNNKELIAESIKCFDTFTICEYYLKNLTEKQFLEDFKSGEVKDSRLLISIKAI